MYPLGAFYGLMNKVVLLGVEVDRGKCVTVCPVDALAYGCGFGGSDAVPGGVQRESSNSKEPSNLDEAVAMYQELMEQENQIFAKNKKLWASRL